MSLATHPPKQDRSRASLERILSAGLEVLAADGWDGFTNAAVASRAGVSTASLYRRFADKDALFLALHRRFSEQLTAEWLPAYRTLARSDLELEDLVGRLVAVLASTFRRHSALLRVFIVRATVDARIDHAGEREIQAVALEFTDALLAHRAEFGHEHPERAVATSFDVVFDTFTRRVLFGRAIDDDWDAAVDELTRMVVSYLRTAGPQ